jgi:hypothetical protein
MAVAQGVFGFFVAAIVVIVLAARLDRYEDELERRFRLRKPGAKGGDAQSYGRRGRDS